MEKIVLEPAFLIYSKPWSETSLIVNLFTLNYGLVSVIAKSARGPRSRFKGCLIPFAPLLITCQGRHDLMQLTALETNGAAYFLQGKNLFNGIYLNELLQKLLQSKDPCPNLFFAYQETLQQLQNHPHEMQKTLRLFEKKLLAELGFALHLRADTSGNEVLPEQYYAYHVTEGVIFCKKNSDQKIIFQGSHLLAIEENRFETKEILAAARRLTRLVFTSLLGNYRLKSRELFGSLPS